VFLFVATDLTSCSVSVLQLQFICPLCKTTYWVQASVPMWLSAMSEALHCARMMQSLRNADTAWILILLIWHCMLFKVCCGLHFASSLVQTFQQVSLLAFLSRAKSVNSYFAAPSQRIVMLIWSASEASSVFVCPSVLVNCYIFALICSRLKTLYSLEDLVMQ